MKTKLKFVALILLSTFSASLSMWAQNTMFTYQGRVQANGVAFTGNGQFKFALVTSTNFNHQATATANPPSGGFITIVNVTFGGNGYSVAPPVTISGGGGSGATATASISGGIVTGIAINNPGFGYTSTPTVTVAPPPPNIVFTTYWSNDGTSFAGSEPIAAVSKAVSNGLFTVVLGDTTVANMAAISAALFVQPNLQLRIWFNDGVNGFAVLNPPQNLTPAPYAIQAANAATATTAVSANSVAAANITGLLSLAQVQGAVVTNNQTGVNFTGTFAGNGGALTNLSPNSLVLASTNFSITTWGMNEWGQRNVPAGLIDVTSVAAGTTHTLALKANGTVVAWGGGTTVDTNSTTEFGQSIIPPGLSNVTAISAGYLHSLALQADKTVVAWGAGTITNSSDGVSYGQSIVPAGLSGINAVAAGGLHNLALRSNGTVVAWGAGSIVDTNDVFQGGQSIVPAGLSNVASIAAGYVHSLALSSNGTIVVWGAGQTNAGSDADYGQRIIPAGLSNVVAAVAGGLHNVALKADGTVVAWGAGLTNDPSNAINSGQSIVPAGLSNVVAIGAGLIHSLALKSDGTVVAWGGNPYGQTAVPNGLNNVVALARGSMAYHSAVLRRRSTAPVAWLDSDNTFNGSVQVNGDFHTGGNAHIAGELTSGSGLRLNDSNIWFRAGLDKKNGLGWYGTNKTFGTFNFTGDAPNGPILFGLAGGALGTTTNADNVALSWDSSRRVGIGTTTPSVRLSLGGDDANTKLLLRDDGAGNGIGMGVSGGRLRFHLDGGGDSFDAFSFLNGPAGTEVFSINHFGTVRMGSSGQYFAAAASDNIRIVRGVINSAGLIFDGSGFSCSRPGVGVYNLTFSPAFTGTPTVTATAVSGVGRVVTTTSVSSSAAGIRIFFMDGNPADVQFNFIAIGPR